eukprot:223852-Pelagomonas_calceolata.AAC.2
MFSCQPSVLKRRYGCSHCTYTAGIQTPRLMVNIAASPITARETQHKEGMVQQYFTCTGPQEHPPSSCTTLSPWPSGSQPAQTADVAAAEVLNIVTRL